VRRSSIEIHLFKKRINEAADPAAKLLEKIARICKAFANPIPQRKEVL
jgi:hypothetical protein